MERFWCNIATYVINLYVDCVLFSLIGWVLEGWGIHKKNMLTEVDHTGHKFVKYCRLKLARSVMKYCLLFRCTCWIKRVRCLTALLE